eukprot:GHVH01005183.1.p1 GENE.GHVH01005183.1~~GHVH01005183.1.p1  ORF type:complete len:103 (+),score=7.17 GHVH01005183.1:278-586(+)
MSILNGIFRHYIGEDLLKIPMIINTQICRELCKNVLLFVSAVLVQEDIMKSTIPASVLWIQGGDKSHFWLTALEINIIDTHPPLTANHRPHRSPYRGKRQSF